MRLVVRAKEKQHIGEHLNGTWRLCMLGSVSLCLRREERAVPVLENVTRARVHTGYSARAQTKPGVSQTRFGRDPGKSGNPDSAEIGKSRDCASINGDRDRDRGTQDFTF
jgi:hypothetical protein